MQNNIIKRKVFATIFIITLIIVGFSPVTQSFTIKENSVYIKNILITQNNGTLSGFVRDSSNNPIEGTLVRVYFHEEYREDFSDSNGYYHVVDIPICYCLKNATCSKEGCRTEWVLLAIVENTTYDFTLYPSNEGTLSGFVRDSSNNPIEGALVRVYFHEEYREDFSDSNGYYHVVDIPICWCLKNATCSKEGYKTEWVLLAIYTNTTYDFTLYPLGPCYPVINGTLGWNGWYISSVEISFVYDPEEVAEIWYYYKGWHNYTEPFIIDDEGGISVEFYCINHEGDLSPIGFFDLKIDKTSPITLLQWDVYKIGLRWYAKFIFTAEDPLSGLAPNLLIYINDLLQAEFFVTTWPIFWFEFQWSKSFKFLTFRFECYDNAGNIAYESINGSDIKSFNIKQCFSTQRFYNVHLQHFIKNFTNHFFNFLKI